MTQDYYQRTARGKRMLAEKIKYAQKNNLEIDLDWMIEEVSMECACGKKPLKQYIEMVMAKNES